MDKLKAFLTLVAVILGMIVALAAIGLVYTALQYLLVFGVVILIGFVVVRYLTRREPRQIDKSDPQRELHQAERTLAEYKRKLK